MLANIDRRENYHQGEMERERGGELKRAEGSKSTLEIEQMN